MAPDLATDDDAIVAAACQTGRSSCELNEGTVAWSRIAVQMKPDNPAARTANDPNGPNGPNGPNDHSGPVTPLRPWTSGSFAAHGKDCACRVRHLPTGWESSRARWSGGSRDATVDACRATREPFDASAFHIFRINIAEGRTESAGKLDAEQQSRGIVVPFADLLIGATALSLGYSVLTVNARHFGRIPGLSVIQL